MPERFSFYREGKLMATPYDVIIIGTGAGGGTLARHLAPSGKRILLLERGDWLPRELENWDGEAVFEKNRENPLARIPSTIKKPRRSSPRCTIALAAQPSPTELR